MKFAPMLCLAAFALSACTTLENRRDMYSPQTVRGPYTRMLHNGIPRTTTTVTVQGSSDYKETVK